MMISSNTGTNSKFYMNQEEKKFITEAIYKGFRVDGRKFEEENDIISNDGNNLASDISRQYESGNTAIQLNIVFLPVNEENGYIGWNREIKEYIPDFPRNLNYDILLDGLEEAQVAVNLKMDVMRNDGKVEVLFYHALKEIFRTVFVPNISCVALNNAQTYLDYMLSSNRETIKLKLNMIDLKIVAFFHDSDLIGIQDPTILERYSSSFNIFMYIKDNKVVYYTIRDIRISMSKILLDSICKMIKEKYIK